MSIIFKYHGFHSDTKSVHTLCGGFAEDRDLLMRKFIHSLFILRLSSRSSTEWIAIFLTKLFRFALLGKFCSDCKIRQINIRLGMSPCFCLDSRVER
jgi:hypothetical protein